MMEVKQNTTTDLNQMKVSSLSAEDSLEDHNVDAGPSKNLKPIEVSGTNGETNGKPGEKMIDIDLDVADIDALAEPISSDMEDALLDDADEETSETPNPTEEVVPKEDKVETSSTASSEKLRDVGDDLDTLLSKINDIVEDCIDQTQGGKASQENKVSSTDSDVTEEVVDDKEIKENDAVSSNLDEDVEMTEEQTDKKAVEEEPPKSPNSMTDGEIKSAVTENRTDGVSASDEAENKEDIAEAIVEIPTEEESMTVDSPENVNEEVDSTENIEPEEDQKGSESIEPENEVEEAAKNSQSETVDDTNNTLDNPAVEEPSNPVVGEKAAISMQDNEETIEDTNKNEIEEIVPATEEVAKDTETANVADSDDEVTAIENEIPTLTVDDDDDDPEIECPENANKGKVSIESSVESKDKSEQDLGDSKPTQPEDDSDDDVVFFLDKEPEEKSTEKSNIQENSSNKMEIDEDDVVLLDDDDDEYDQQKPSQTPTVVEVAVNEDAVVSSTDNSELKAAAPSLLQTEVVDNLSETSKEVSENSSTVGQTKDEATEKQTQLSLLSDNSDNARDDFATCPEPPKEAESETSAQVSTTEKNAKVSAEADETTSNCSSSSNLLQEAKPSSLPGDDEVVEDPEMEEDDDVELEGQAEVDEVELVEDLDETSKDASVGKLESEDNTTETAAPPAKRIRLSEDFPENEAVKSEDKVEPESIATQTETETTGKSPDVEINLTEETIKEQPQVSTSVAVKRSHDEIECADTEKSELPQETTQKKAKPEETTEICPKIEEISPADSVKLEENVQLKTEEVQIDFKPKAYPSTEPIPLYPPPKFADNVTSFSIDFFKRFKKSCSNLTKSDLEELALQKIVETIVHKSEFSEMRELIEKQEKIISAHRTRITELSKQFRDLEMVHNRVLRDIEQKNSQFIMPVKITRAVGLQVYIPNKKGGSINESLSSAMGVPGAVPSSSNQIVRSSPQHRVSSQTSPIRPQVVPTAAADSSTNSSSFNRLSSGGGALSSAAAAAALNSRKKITPQRPMETNSAYRSPSAQIAGNSSLNQAAQSKVLNKNPSTSALPPQRRSFPATGLPTVQQQMQHQGAARQQQQGSANNAMRFKQNNAPPSKLTQNNSSPATQQQPQQFRNPQNKNMVDNYLSSLPSGGSVSITPAKPKDKSFIDLTDEDDAPQQQANMPQRPRTAGVSPAASNNAAYLSQQQQQQRNSLTRLSPAAAAAQKNARPNAPKSNGNSSAMPNLYTPPGTSITRVHVGSNSSSSPNPQSRMKFGHPAPLPTAPPQPYNAAWKLPPPRPTIRISNLENGIVISWTMEEAMDRHADCVSYQIYAYQETTGAPSVDSWRHVGDVKAMLLPMAVTLTQFQEGQRYYFAVRAVDGHQRFGPFSLPKTWS